MNTNDQIDSLLKEIFIPASQTLLNDRFNPENKINVLAKCEQKCSGSCDSGSCRAF